MALAGWRAAAQTAAAAATPTLYYVDGYHGGSRGHMPAGSWRDILNAMRAIPEWKMSLDIEPASWDDLRREDPQAYHELQNSLKTERGCPRGNLQRHVLRNRFGWAHGGESNIRQLQRGPRSHPRAFSAGRDRHLRGAGALLVELPAAIAALASGSPRLC